MRFGEWVRTTAPGLHYHLPTPIESVMTPDVTRDNRIEVGYRSFGGALLVEEMCQMNQK
jgi:membrane protease subunit HflK